MSNCAVSVALPLHSKMSQSNDDALKNIKDILVTPLVSQEEISPLKDVAFSNALSIFVTLEVSQVEIDAPSFVVIVPKVGHKPSRGDSARHAETELKKEASVTQKSGLAQTHVSTGPSTAE